MKRNMLVFVVVLVLATACTSAPTPTPVPPTTVPTPIPPTATLIPSTATATSVPPTTTPILVPPTQLPSLPTPTACLFRDDFDVATLNSVWSWVREDKTHWSLSASSGNLQITTRSKESIFGKLSNQKNLLLQKAPAGNFEIITKVAFDPTKDFQKASLLVYQDDDNFVMLSRSSCAQCRGGGVDLSVEVIGKSTLGFDAGMYKAFPRSPVYLKIGKDGTRYKGYYSADGTSWTQVGEQTHSGLADIKIGITATNDSNAETTEIPADFDYFCVMKSP